ncbi:MAG TPA: alpha/beta hydrolase, partial [Polyangiaceae bacterium]|nr:alpha/beta hydrolase [Polyangiaceae bacterium]
CTIAFCDAKLISALETSRQVVAVEPQGMGHTADIDRPFSYEQLADDTVALMRRLHIEKADVFGFSIGGGIAQQVAIRHPEVVRDLIVASSPYSSDGWYPQVTAGEQAITPAELTQSPFYEAYLQVAPRPQDWPTYVEKEKALALTAYDWTTSVSEISSPTMIVAGDSDSVRPEAALGFFKLLGGGVPGDFQPLPRARLVVLPGTAHPGVMLSDLLPQAITPFLDSTSGDAGSP